jgi:hypothetical protein
LLALAPKPIKRAAVIAKRFFMRMGLKVISDLVIFQIMLSLIIRLAIKIRHSSQKTQPFTRSF